MITGPIPFPRFLLLLLSLTATAGAADKEAVFSGPQAGERITPFQVLGIRGDGAGKEFNPVREGRGAATTLVFVHGLERSMTPLMSVVDEYGAARQDRMRTAFVFLSDDRLASEQRLPLVGNSLKMRTPMVLSLDGGEGPGNYGLNKECLLTIIIAKDDRVTANFAFVQPGIADAPKVIAAMAKVIGDDAPPTADALREKRMAMNRGMAAKRGDAKRPAPKGDLPGAAPTDAELIGLLRSFIQKTNTDADVDKVIGRVEAYVKGNPDLTRQAVDGWTRVLHIKYGTGYAQKAGAALVERLKK